MGPSVYFGGWGALPRSTTRIRNRVAKVQGRSYFRLRLQSAREKPDAPTVSHPNADRGIRPRWENSGPAGRTAGPLAFSFSRRGIASHHQEVGPASPGEVASISDKLFCFGL